MSSSSYEKLRRLADRAPRIQERRAKESGAIAAYGETLPKKAADFSAAYDRASKYEGSWRKATGTGHEAVATLARNMQGWMPLCERDIPGFALVSSSMGTGVPDDTLRVGDRLLKVIDEHRDAEGKGLPYRDTAMVELREKLTAARASWGVAEAADSEYQQLLAEVRATGEVFDTELQAFRRSLRSAFGTTDKDYQRLRAKRSSRAEEAEEDEGEGEGKTPPGPVPPKAPAPEAVVAAAPVKAAAVASAAVVEESPSDAG